MMLLTLDHEGVTKLVETMEKEVNEIKKGSLQFSWYMRGGVSYEDVLNMSVDERKFINEIINSNLETTKNSKLPFF
jgi:hypothetical protein